MSEKNTSSIKILIVEDDLVDLKLLERLLSRSPLSQAIVQSATYLEAAKQMLREEQFDIVLSDLGLPDSCGLEAVKGLQECSPDTPLIVLSGLDDEATAVSAVKHGVQDYLIKGQVDGQVLVRAIQYAIERKKSERNLQSAEQLYRTIFENSAVAIMMVDDQERLVSWNRFTESLLGRNKEQLHLCPIRELYPEDEWEKIRAHNVRQKGMQHHLETRMIRNNGEIIDVDVSLSVLRGSDGRVEGSIGVIRNITERKQAEEQLDRSYSLLHATLESTADGLLVVDNTGTITSYNQKFVELWEVPSEVLEAGDSQDLMASMLERMENADAFAEQLQRIDRHPELICDGILHFNDGRAFEHYSQPQYVAGQVTGRVWSFRDITEQKKVEEALRRSEQRFRQVVDNAQEWIWEVDANGLYTYVSPVVEKLLGYQPEEMLGKMHFFDLYDPEERERLKAKAFEVFNRKDTFREFENKNLHKNGQCVWLSKSGVPIIDEDGQLVGYRGVDVDITERRRIHEVLNRKQKNLEAIFDAAPVGMLLMDESIRVRRANDAIRQLAGRDYAQIINQFPGYVLGCKYAHENPAHGDSHCGNHENCRNCGLYNTIQRAIDTGLPVHGVEIQPKMVVNGRVEEPVLSISAEPVIIDGSHYAVVAVNDVTDRVKAERELRETMEIKSQFISTVSHELRTPLASMKEAVLIVLDGIAGEINEDQRHFLDVAKRNIERLSRLINDVLDFQKLGAHKMKFQMQKNDMVKIIEDAYGTMVHYANKRNVHLKREFQDQLPHGVFDADRVIQVLTNLLSNAVKFTPEGGSVTISAGTEGHEYYIRVSDTGMGIPKEAMTKIFDRFYRVQRPGQEIKGTGLGLAIVKRIVRAHGGRIEVESKVNEGTTFIVHLPIEHEVGEILSESSDHILEKAIVDHS